MTLRINQESNNTDSLPRIETSPPTASDTTLRTERARRSRLCTRTDKKREREEGDDLGGRAALQSPPHPTSPNPEGESTPLQGTQIFSSFPSSGPSPANPLSSSFSPLTSAEGLGSPADKTEKAPEKKRRGENDTSLTSAKEFIQKDEDAKLDELARQLALMLVGERR